MSKSAMQELIECINARDNISNFVIRDKAIKLLEKEKEQIIGACWYGHDIKHEYFNPIDYFEINYNQPKQITL